MFDLAVPWWEIVARAGLIYLSVLLLLRLTGKRQVGQFTTFDLAVLLLISEACSNALSGGDDSVLGAFIGVATLLALNTAAGWVTTRWFWVERALEGRPQFLIRNGRVDYKVLARESLTKNDLLAALRAEGCFTPDEADYAVLETSGRITVRKRGDQSVSG